MDPSFSMGEAQGRKKVSVLTFLGSMPGPSQKLPVSLRNRLQLTIQSSWASPSRTFLESDPEQAGFMPQVKAPENLRWYIRSIMGSQLYCAAEPFSSLGRQL